jgi:hypothetical protein
MFCHPYKQKPVNMKRNAWIVVPALIVLYCCNSEKKVLRNPEKTQNVVNAWLKAHPLKIDTNFVYIPGDTTTTLLIGYDTTTVRDTVTNLVEKIVTKTKTVTNTVHDTVKVTIGCSGVKEPCALLKAAQDGLAGKTAQYDQQVLETQRQKLRADKWKFRFWVGVSIFGLLVALVIGIKLFKPRIPGT